MKQIKYTLFIALLVFMTLKVHSQGGIKIGNNPTTINSNSLLELESTSKGLLFPRLSLSATNNASPMGSHIAGMVIYNTATAGDVTPGIYYNNGSNWLRVSITGEVSLTNTSLTSATSPTGTATGQLIYNTNSSAGVPVGPVYWNGSSWKSVSGPNVVSLSSSTSPAGSSLGEEIYNTNGNSGVGRGLATWNGSQWISSYTPDTLRLSSSSSPSGTMIGQIVYNTNTNLNVGPCYWDGTEWKGMMSSLTGTPSIAVGETKSYMAKVVASSFSAGSTGASKTWMNGRAVTNTQSVTYKILSDVVGSSADFPTFDGIRMDFASGSYSGGVYAPKLVNTNSSSIFMSLTSAGTGTPYYNGSGIWLAAGAVISRVDADDALGVSNNDVSESVSSIIVVHVNSTTDRAYEASWALFQDNDGTNGSKLYAVFKVTRLY